MVELENKRSSEATTELQTIHNSLQQLESKSTTASKMLYETEYMAPFEMSALARRGRKLEPKLTIVRSVNNSMLELPATETTLLEPGDTLKVEVPLPDDDATSSIGSMRGASAPLLGNSPRRAALGSADRASD